MSPSGIKFKNQFGFTLVELMISTAILMVVVFTGYYSYSLYANSWEKRSNKFWDETNSGIAIELINKVIGSCFPYIVDSKTSPEKNIFVFKGTPIELTCVTREAVFSPKEALINIVFSKEDKKIYYNELPLDDYVLTKWPRTNFEWKYKIVIFEKMNNIEFRYSGYESLEQAVKINSDRVVDSLFSKENEIITYSNYDSVEKRVFPFNITLHLYHSRVADSNTILNFNFDKFSYESLLNYRQYQD
ncbi:PilW family protein [Pseudoalteromonas xiamenensis]